MFQHLAKQLPRCGRNLLKSVLQDSTRNTRNMANVAVNGMNINYEKAGSGSSVALCMPGAMGSALTDFGAQLKSLAGPELTLVAWDPPGYGQSRPPARQFPPTFFKDDALAAAEVMKTLGYERYHVLGWSDGGNSAVILAALRPQSVTKLVIWGANAYVGDKDQELYEALRDIDKWSARMKAPMIEMYGEEYFRTTWNAWIDGISAFKEIENGVCRKETREVRCPTLVVHGAKDAMVPPEHPEYFKQHIPDARLHVFPDGKHNLHMKYADEFNKLVRVFLAE
ncbi:valacyclovir hydrolase-like isoform X2 [Amphibalanus amphitrite]|uniref:valacyclovir hydrolase-like isoform X2 n=1 Tax=Amphibalanus amphitrite TaxID=1232801 RepID=UPI001C92A255|nr:valacyclovir hydrolase-like isoform X2 [Amphibalanus amphitrite]